MAKQNAKTEETDTLEKKVKKLLTENRRTLANNQFTIPSPHEYRHQWLWDSCFHAIALRHFDTQAAQKELISLTTSQKKNGMIPHESNYTILGHRMPHTSRVTQPPLIARATLDVYKKSNSKDFLNAMLPALQKYHQWLETHRESQGLYKVTNPIESGEDNAIIWDAYVPEKIHRNYGIISSHIPLPNLPHIKHATDTSIYADALDCMAEMSQITGNPQLQKHYANKKQAVAESMKKLMMQQDGNYHSLTHDSQPIITETHSIFTPLFAGILKKTEAENLVDTLLLNKEKFWTKYPIPTVAADNPKFNQKFYWRGPTWININWMIHRGLQKYGMNETANQLLQKTTEVIKKSGFREYYNPLTGQGMGAKNFSWSTLILDMIKQK